MRKMVHVRTIAMLLAAGLLLLLTACEGGRETTAPVGTSDCTDEEVIEFYRQAGYVYGWFEIYNISFDEQDEKELNGMRYYRVTHETVRDMNSLRTHLGEYFSENIINTLLNVGSSPAKFAEIDGALYTTPTVRAADRFAGDESFFVVRSQSGDLINLQVDVQHLNNAMEPEGTKEYTFVLKKLNDRWLFENFSLVR